MLKTLITAIAILFLVSATAEAAPIGAAIAALSSWWAGASLVIKLGVMLAVNIGTGLLEQYRARKAAKKAADKQVRGVTLQVQMGDTLPRSYLLGKRATAGYRKYAGSWGAVDKTPNAFFVDVRELSCLPSHAGPTGLTAVRMADIYVTVLWDQPHPDGRGYPVAEYRSDGQDYLWIKYLDGTQTTADPYLLATFGTHSSRPWKSTMIGRGCQAVIVTMRRHEQLYRSGIPEMLFVPAPMRLYDPRKDTTNGGSGAHRWGDVSTYEPSDNLPMMAYNVARGMYYGGRWVHGGRNFAAHRLPVSSWMAALNEADRDMGGGRRQFRGGLEVRVNETGLSVLEKLRAGCAGRFAEVGGSLKMLVGAPAAAVWTMTDETIVVTRDQDYEPFPSLKKGVNTIRPTYPEPAIGWRDKDAPQRSSAALLERDGGEELAVDVDLEAVDDVAQVQCIAATMIEEAQRWRTHRWVLPPSARPLEPNDVLGWSSFRNNYSSKKFIISHIVRLAGCLWEVTVQELDPSDYDPPEIILPPVTGPTGSVPVPPQPMSGWTAVPASIDDESGTARRPAVRVGCSADLDDIEAVHVRIWVKDTELLVFDNAGSTPYPHPGPGAVYSWLLSGSWAVPGARVVVRGRLVPFSERETLWSDPIEVLLPNLLIASNDILDAAITELKLADRAVSSLKIQLEAVTTELISPASATSTKIADVAVVASKIANEAVTNLKLANEAVSTAKLQVAAVTQDILANGAVIAAKIADGAVNTAKFAAGIEPVGIIAGAVVPTTKTTEVITVAGKLYRWNGTAYVASVSSVDLTGQIISSQIADAAVTVAKFASGIQPVGIIAGSTVPTTKTTEVITVAGKLYRWNGTAYVSSVPAIDLTGQIGSSQIADGSVNTAKFAAGIQPVGIIAGSTVPTTRTTEVITVNGKLYRWSGTAYVASVPATDLTGQLTNSQIADLAAAKVTGQLVSAQIADASITMAKFGVGLRPVEIVNSLPDAPHVEGRTVFLTSNDKLYRNTGSGWTASVAADDITGQVAAAQIAGIEASKITGQLSDAQIAAVAAAKVTGQIVGTQIADDAISTPKLLAGAVSTNKLAAGSVIADKLAANAVTSVKIEAGAVETAKLAAGAVVADKIASGAVTTGKLDALAVTTEKLAANAITAGKIATGAVVAGKIAADAVTANEIAANSVTTAKIATGAVVAGKIAANAVTANEIAANSVTTAKIATGAVTANELAVNSVVAGKIAAGAVSATEIAANAITTDKLAANSISSDKLAANSVIAGKVAAGAISTTELAAKAVTVDKMIVQSSDNLVPDDGFDGENWSLQPATVFGATNISGGKKGIIYTKPADGSTGYAQVAYSRFFPVSEGQSYLVSAKTYSTAVHFVWARVDFYNGAGASLGFSGGPAANQPAGENTWTITSTAPAGAVQARFIIYVQRSSVVNGQVVQIAEPRVMLRNAGQLIVDGSIVANHLSANSVTTAKIATGAVTANELAANSVTAAKIVAGAITGTEIAAQAIAAKHVVVADWENLLPSGTFSQGFEDYWDVTGTGATNPHLVTGVYTKTGQYSLNLQKGDVTKSINANLKQAYRPAVVGGQTYYFETEFVSNQGASAGAYFRIKWYDVVWTLISYTDVAGNAPITTSWTVYSSKLVAPATARYVSIELYNHSTQTTAQNLIFDRIVIRRANAASLVVDGSIITDHLAANAITTAKISAGAVTATEIAAGAVTAIKIAAATITGDKIAANTIASEKLVASSITARELVLADWENMIPDGNFNNASGPNSWDVNTGTWAIGTVGAWYWNGDSQTGQYALVLNNGVDGGTGGGSPPQISITTKDFIPVTSGESLAWEVANRTTDGSSAVGMYYRIYWYNRLKVLTTYTDVLENVSIPSTWTTRKGVVSVPAGAAYCRVRIYHNSNSTTRYNILDRISLRKAKGAELIVDGTILTDHLGANSVTAAKIVAGSITANELGAGSVTAIKLAAGAVTADKMSVANLAAISATLGNVDISQANIGTLLVKEHNIEIGAVTRRVTYYQDHAILCARLNDGWTVTSIVTFFHGLNSDVILVHGGGRGAGLDGLISARLWVHESARALDVKGSSADPISGNSFGLTGIYFPAPNAESTTFYVQCTGFNTNANRNLCDLRSLVAFTWKRAG